MLILYIPIFFMAGSVFAEDVLILHQSYGNTHNKWKNRLENAGHTVTSQTSEPSSFSGYEQVIDLRYSTDANLDTSSDATNQAYKTILAAGGTIVLNGEHSGFANPRNNDIQAFVREVTGDSTITYSTTSSTSGSMATTTVLSTLPSDWSHFNTVAAGIVSDLGDNGKCIAANGSGNCAVALFDGDALSSSYTNGKIVVITDINYASHSSYYTSDNQEFLTSLISDVTTSTVVTVANVSGISTSQQSTVTTTRNATQSNNRIYITQSGVGVDLAITQDGEDNLVIGTDLSSAASIVGDYNDLTVTQTNDNNILGIDINGNSNDVDITQNTDQRALVSIAGASNTLNLNQSGGDNHSSIAIVGNSNVMDIDQTESGNKILFLDVDGSNNVTVDQKGTGAHFLEIALTDSHTLDITQDGSGSHNASINLSGNASTLNLTQDSSTNQNYSLSQNCTQTSCSATVTQN